MAHISWLSGAVAIALGIFSSVPSSAQQAAEAEALLAVYGPYAGSREGDPDRMQRLFFSVPSNTPGPLFLRVFDPDFGGPNDSILGLPNGGTTFRFFGGEGAFSAVPRPVRARDGARSPRFSLLDPIDMPGVLLDIHDFSDLGRTEAVWDTFVRIDPSQGERLGDRIWFRLDALGTRGDDGNAFQATLSTSGTETLAPAGQHIVAYSATFRWPGGDPVEVRVAPPADAPVTIQNFDAAWARLTVVTDYEDFPLRASGQDDWAGTRLTIPDSDVAITLFGGAERPNDVTLSVFDQAGVALPLIMPPTRARILDRPVPVAEGRPLPDCTSVTFDASRSHGARELLYAWDFGDGDSATEAVVDHRYAAPGAYRAELKILDKFSPEPRGNRLFVPVLVRPAPVAALDAPVLVAPGQRVRFSGADSVPSGSPITRWIWSFGDGAGGTGVKPVHAYETPGVYRVALRVEDDSGHICDFGEIAREIAVNHQPRARAGEDQVAKVGDMLRFSGGSSDDEDGTLIAWRWDMGDGTVLQGPDISHTYTDAGDYTVTLTVTDDSGVSNETARDQLRVIVNAPPVPVAVGPSRPVAVAEVVGLDGSESFDANGRIQHYAWDFGDSASGEGAVVQHTWDRPGVYTVKLTVTDDSGTPSATRSTTTEVVVSAAPVAEAGPDQFVNTSVVAFDGGASADPDGAITDWAWDFGDGGTGNGREVAHAYRSPGTYEVTLVVRDDSGAPLNQAQDTMRVTVNAVPLADAGPDLVVAPGEVFYLDGTGSVDPDGEVVRWSWTFPGGELQEGALVTGRTDDPGLYRIGLRIEDDFRGEPATASDEMMVAVNAPPVAEIGGTDRRVEPGVPVRFSAANSYDPDGGPLELIWDFGDLQEPLTGTEVERVFETPGNVPVQLTVIDASGVMNAAARTSIEVAVNHRPVAEAGPDIATDILRVDFDASGSADADGDRLVHVWDFGDGSPPVTGRAVRHTFPRAGQYPVTLRVDDGTGLGNSSDTDALAVRIDAPPIAVAGANRDVCSGDPIPFDASASRDPEGGRLRYSWDFGDGTGSDLVNPTKVYERPGSYSVTLTVRDESGSPRGLAVDRIAALVREGPIADAGPDLRACANHDLRFDGTASTDADGAVNAYAWTFGDGASGIGATPTHVYGTPGTYAVTLTITGDARGQCRPLDTDELVVEVSAAPRLTIETRDRLSTTAANRFSAVLSDLGNAGPGEIHWDFGDGTTAIGASVEKRYETPGTYTVQARTRVTGETEGCGDVATQRVVVVNAAPVAVIDGPVLVTVGDEVAFDAGQSSNPDGAITDFAWELGDGTAAQGIRPLHVFRTPGRHEVRLEVLDDAAVENSRSRSVHMVTVVPAPAAVLGELETQCPGVPVTLASGFNADVAAVWDFADGASGEGPEVQHSFALPGLYPVSLRLDDGRGLPGSLWAADLPVRVNAPPTALAGPDRVVCPGDEVLFDGSGSGDPDGRITAWRWEFSDGMVMDGQQVSRRTDAPGVIVARLIVTDDSAAGTCSRGEDTAQVRVNAAPRVSAGADRSTFVGGARDTLDFEATATDPDGDGLLLDWDFGDGTTARGASASHAYAAPGAYQVILTARDATGLACGMARDSVSVTASARP